MKAATDLGASPIRASRAWVRAVDATLAATWSLMVLGALTRASMAGLACPDWPLCHGYLVPPLDPGAYPRESGYEVYKVYLEFTHRVLAGIAAVGTVLLGWKAWGLGWRALAAGLGGVLALQIGMGAATVWLGNAPYTVVLHLGLALSFFTLLLAVRRRIAPGERGASTRGFGAAYAMTAALAAAQMLVGATVSSKYFGMACPDYPLCEGRVWPAPISASVAWQLLHRGLGALLLAGVAALAVAAFASPAGARERRFAAVLAGGVAAQALLGGINVWLQIPPWASALHMGLAIAVFGLVAARVLQRTAVAARAG